MSTHYIVDHALSMGMFAPLIIFASSEARNAMPRATSSTPIQGTGVPSLSFATCIWTTGLRMSAGCTYRRDNTHKKELNPAESKCSICTEDAMFVATPPGSTLLQRIPSWWKRHATFLVAPISMDISYRLKKMSIVRHTNPCLLAVYAMPEAAPEVPALLATLMIDPLFCSFMNGRTAFIRRTGTVRLIAITRSHSSSCSVSALLHPSLMPAQLTRTSTLPCCW
jgi:hypothetical protein